MFNVLSGYMALILLVLLVGESFAVETLDDPMKPPGSTRQMSQSSGKVNWNLTSTLVSGGRRVAMINNRLVAVGEKVAGAEVISISGNSVRLMIDGKPVRIGMSLKSLRKKSK